MLEGMPKNLQFRQTAPTQETAFPSKTSDGISNGLLLALFFLLVLAVITWWHFSSKNTERQNTDISPTPTLSVLDALSPEVADLNQDGHIDASDAAQLRESFYKTDSKSLQADFNQDGKVDASDYSLFVSLQEKMQLDSATESTQ